MKNFLGIVVLSLLWCNTVFSVESLTEGQKGTVKFESIPVVTLNQFLKGETEGESVQISGKLQFPNKKWTDPRPAVVILHGGGGVSDNQKAWAAKTKNTTKYQKEANKKARKAVADFFISTFEITPL